MVFVYGGKKTISQDDSRAYYIYRGISGILIYIRVI